MFGGIQKRYPENVTLENGAFLVSLSQEETFGDMDIETLEPEGEEEELDLEGLDDFEG